MTTCHFSRRQAPGKSLHTYLKYNFENEGNVLTDILRFLLAISYLNVKIISTMIEIINLKINSNAST